MYGTAFTNPQYLEDFSEAMKAHRDRSGAKGLELSLGYVGTLQDQDPDIWLHKIQLVTMYSHLGTWANTDLGYRAESTRSAEGFWVSEEVWG